MGIEPPIDAGMLPVSYFSVTCVFFRATPWWVLNFMKTVAGEKFFPFPKSLL
jgi:hypothetical protein